MHTSGIICEYNPFHNGHLYQIEKLRAAGSDAIICVMSGNITQRGDFALCDKYLRAKMALLCGADIVFELPFPFSSASAEYFATAGVSILASFGVDEINFGSECGDINLLSLAADGESLTDVIKQLKADKPNSGNTEIYTEAMARLHPELNGVEFSSNDLLAIAYIKAAKKCMFGGVLTTIKRKGAGYRCDRIYDSQSEFTSAAALRRKLYEGANITSGLTGFMPQKALDILASAAEEGLISSGNGFDSVYPSMILRYLTNDIAGAGADADYAECGGGLYNRLVSAASISADTDEFFRNAATKRYTDSRIRRAMIFSLTDVKQNELKKSPAYTTLLASNAVGRTILSNTKNKSGRIDILTKPADYIMINEPETAETIGARRQHYLSEITDALFGQTLIKRLSSDYFIKRTPFIL